MSKLSLVFTLFLANCASNADYNKGLSDGFNLGMSYEAALTDSCIASKVKPKDIPSCIEYLYGSGHDIEELKKYLKNDKYMLKVLEQWENIK